MDTQAIPDLDKGQELYAARRYAEAEAFFREAAVHHPALSAAYRGLARSLAALTRFADAIEQYRKAGELLRSDAPERDAVLTEQRETLRNWGEALSDRGRLEEAAAKYEEALRIDPDDVDTYEGLDHVARVLAEKQRFNEADKLYQEANDFGREKNARNRRVILRLWGQALSQRDRFDEAAAKYQEALSIEPDDASTYEGLDDIARALAEKQRFDEADKLYQRAYDFGREKNAGNRRVILRRWGEALSQRDRFDEAAAKYQEALSIEPDDQETCDAYADLAHTLAEKQRFDEVDKLYQQANELLREKNAGNRSAILRWWGEALSQRDLFDEAVAKYQEALSIEPDAEIHELLGGVLADTMRFDEAIEQYRAAAELRPKEPRILCSWGDVLKSKDLPEQAVAKYREALQIEDGDATAHYGLGLGLSELQDFDTAIAQFDRARKLWQKSQETGNESLALRQSAYALNQTERFEEAAQKCKSAVEIAPDEAWGYFDFANVLSDGGRYRDAIDQLGKAIKLDPDNPYLHHNKADFSFRLGRYEEGWREWDEAKRCYRQALRKGVIKSDHASQATYFGDVLREVYYDYRASEAHYRKALDKDKDNYLAWAGLAILYQQWSDSDEPSPEAQAKLSFTVARARELLERRTERGVPFATLLSLADLHIETHDWTEAENNLERAAKVCGKSRLRRGQVSGRLGLIRFRTQRYAEAIENFREALLARPDDMTLRTSLGRALLQSKQFDAAEVEFARVLKSARGNIDARLGLAQLCIDLADDGDPDRYVSAEEHLETALELGRNGEGGSVRLDGSELANVYYLRGYTRVKRYEKDTLLARLVAPLSSLNGALSDFEQCRAANPGHPKASAAIAKIKKQFQRQRGESLTDFIGPLVIVVAGFAVFVLAQLDFYFHDTRLGLPNKPAMQGVGYYIAATFGALMFMVAGLYLPKVLKLKVGAIELEKTSVEQVSAPSGLDIGRLSMS